MKFASTSYRTGADVKSIRRAIKDALPRATVWDAQITSLEELPEVGVMIEKRASLLGGVGLVKLLVHDRGDYREVEVTAVATTVTEGMVAGMARDVSGLRSMSASKGVAEQLATALKGAGPGWQRVG